jgi:hypothetical protein
VNPLAREQASPGMMTNVGSWDRAARAVVALGLAMAAALLSVHPAIRAALGGSAAYLAFSALAGTCVGYRLLGRSTCRT